MIDKLYFRGPKTDFQAQNTPFAIFNFFPDNLFAFLWECFSHGPNKARNIVASRHSSEKPMSCLGVSVCSKHPTFNLSTYSMIKPICMQTNNDKINYLFCLAILEAIWLKHNTGRNSIKPSK
jgi:hypothetical protein